MVEGVADDGVVGGEQRLEEAAVGVEAGGVEYGVLGVEVVGDGFLQLLVQVLGAADEAYGAHAVAALVHGLLGGLDQARVVAQAQVVVGAEVEHFARGPGHGDISLLGSGDDTFVLVQACVLDVLQFLGEVVLELFVHGIGVFCSHRACERAFGRHGARCKRVILSFVPEPRRGLRFSRPKISNNF